MSLSWGVKPVVDAGLVQARRKERPISSHSARNVIRRRPRRAGKRGRSRVAVMLK